MITLEARIDRDFNLLVHGNRIGKIYEHNSQIFWDAIHELWSEKDEMLEALEGAKWLIDSFVFNPAYYEGYQDVCNAIKKAGGEE